MGMMLSFSDALGYTPAELLGFFEMRCSGELEEEDELLLLELLELLLDSPSPAIFTSSTLAAPVVVDF